MMDLDFSQFNVTMISPSYRCSSNTMNNTQLFTFAKEWNSIPETIILNLILYFSFLVIFITLRRIAWNRKHVDIRRTSKGWLQSIYGDRKLLTRHLSNVLLISDNDIREYRGNDAYQYLLFQQYIIYFLSILAIFCMLVILPVNMFGDYLTLNHPPKSGFASTTIMNINNGMLYWVHIIGAPVTSLIGIYLMHRFSKSIQLDDEQITRRTLLIRRVPKRHCNKVLLENYFKKTIPNCNIEGVQSIYNVRALLPITNELTNVVNARCYCIEYLELKQRRLLIRPSCFGEFGCLCGFSKCCRKVDGIKFYSEKMEEIQKLISEEWTRSASHPTGSFFVTFETEKMAQEAFVHLKQKQERPFSFCPFAETQAQISNWVKRLFKLTNSDELQVGRWMVSYAPYPDDINWYDITVNLRSQWLRSIILNLILLMVFMFASTPAVILENAQSLRFLDWFKDILPQTQKLPQLISPLILIIAASALPAIVTVASQYIAYYNLSGKNHAIMLKVYLFLILMVIIWPPLGTNSLGVILLNIIENNGKSNDKKPPPDWECLFPANANVGAFFVNYAIQSAFIGNIMELMRIPELLIYLWYRATARSKAEVDTASRYVVWDFGIGIRYPRFLLIFAMVVTYSLSCPLISAAGLVYMVIKHFIDRYNIYYVYNPSKINSKIHSTAIMFVYVSFLMMQLQLFLLTTLKTGPYSSASAVSLFVLIVSMLIFLGQFFFYVFRNINHLTYRATRKQAETNRDYCACSYLPPVLYDVAHYVFKKSPSAISAINEQANLQHSQHNHHQSTISNNKNNNNNDNDITNISNNNNNINHDDNTILVSSATAATTLDAICGGDFNGDARTTTLNNNNTNNHNDNPFAVGLPTATATSNNQLVLSIPENQSSVSVGAGQIKKGHTRGHSRGGSGGTSWSGSGGGGQCSIYTFYNSQIDGVIIRQQQQQQQQQQHQQQQQQQQTKRK